MVVLLSFHLDTRRLILYIIPLVSTLVDLPPPSYTYKTDQLIIYNLLPISLLLLFSLSFLNLGLLFI